MNPAQIDLQQLRIKHILYKSKVRSALYGGSYDPEFFSPAGPVNQWFSSIGLVKYPTEAEIRELNQIQTDLNTSVKYLTDLYSSGKIDQAFDGLSKIESQSDRFLHLVTQLEAKMGK